MPQFYLRYFATKATRDSDAPQVWIFSKDPQDGDEALTNIRNVCGKRYLYSPKLADGERTWDLDNRLNDLESLLGQVWPALATDFADLSDEHIRKGLSLFVAAMHFRHPDIRKLVERTHEDLVRVFGPKNSDGMPLVEAIKVRGKTHKFDSTDWHAYGNLGKDDHDRAFAATVQSKTGLMAQRLLQKRWSVVVALTDTFVTTDKPVVLAHPTRERFGYGTKGTIVTFPLSPTRLLVMDDMHNEPVNQYYPLAESNAGSFNLAVWNGASRFLITGRPISEVLNEICSFANSVNDA